MSKKFSIGTADPALGSEESESTEKNTSSSRTPRSRVRKHLAAYPILATPYHLINDYSPFNIPSRILDNAPGLPEPLDSAVDSGLTSVDKVVEARVLAIKSAYERWVLRPQENIRTGVGVYTEWGKERVAGGLRGVEEGIFSVGEYLLPSYEGHETSDSRSYWTSTESGADSDEEEEKKKEEKVEEAAADRRSTPVVSWPRRKRSASAPTLPPFDPGRPDQELQNIRRLLLTYAHRTYLRNVHKSPGQILYDALDLAKGEAKNAAEGFEEKYSSEIGYLHKMMEAG